MRRARARYFRIVVDAQGPCAVAYDYRNRSVNGINGTKSTTVEEMRRYAKKAWPELREFARS